MLMLFDEAFSKLINQYSYNILTERAEPPIKVLEKYKDDDNAFVSFTDRVSSGMNGSKIGINPTSEFNTPIGVYSYPIKAYWNTLKTGNVHFAGDRPYLYVFKAKNSDKLLYGSKYTEDNYTRDKEELQEIFKNIDLDSIEYTSSEEYMKYPAQKFWTLTRNLAHHLKNHRNIESREIVIWTQILRRFYDGVVDDEGEGFIHRSEPTQAVIWTKAYFDTVDLIDRTINPHMRWDGSVASNYETEWPKIMRQYNKDGKLQYYNIKKILSDPELAYLYIKEGIQGNINMDDIINTISKDNHISFRYATDILQYKNIPAPIIKSIIYADYHFVELLSFMYSSGERLSDDIIDYIASDFDKSFKFVVKVLNWKNIPPKIINTLKNNPIPMPHLDTDYDLVFKYFEHVYKGGEVPQQAIDILSRSGEYITTPRMAFNICKIFKNQAEIPTQIIDKLFGSPEYCYKFLIDIVLKSGLSIYDFNDYMRRFDAIQYTLYNSLDHAYILAKKHFKWKKIPHVLWETLTKYGYINRQNVPKDVTFEESFMFDYQYNKILTEYGRI